jgi:hypothetical protein
MIRSALPILLVALCPLAALAQVPGLPGIANTLDRAGAVARQTLDTAGNGVRSIDQSLATLATGRLDRLDRFVRMHRDSVETDDTGAPARAHELLLLDPDPAALARAAQASFALIEQGDLDGLGVVYARLRAPAGMRLSASIRRLRRLLPGRTITSDPLHFASHGESPANGAAGPANVGAGAASGAHAPVPIPSDRVGIIDGGIRADGVVGARLAAQGGFASGAPRPDAHAQSIASLLAGAGVAHLLVADVYGNDRAGGGALAIARALGWMQSHGARVVSISLVGPANPLLARAVAQVQARGLIVVAAVGNDGPAAPPAYPASYSGVVAVTGVDGRNRVLFEAGHALHLDYAAPGADLTAIGLDGRVQRLRGTSYAAPLVAARLAALGTGTDVASDAATVLRRADHEALAAGPRTGRGILCATCRQGL